MLMIIAITMMTMINSMSVNARLVGLTDRGIVRSIQSVQLEMSSSVPAWPSGPTE